ncbi:hypothetical protein [Methylobacterium organophilum]|uniref:Uncharacterized protein n=1 Tax=Methylobacterium organophilum TaxID=410 RepID=A0ABQ4T5C9_METOR|nr:hypothetical protein [Methylobacterium organophilum]UMY19020.1 hypothetical protein MMB17_06880 [Methylobacterium organophilum]GJE25446.1 hypothetical protein LKMONMHP_0284 [Methylobacterium organophilum]
MKRFVLAATAAVTLATAVPASAQYYRDYGYDRPPPPRYYRDEDDDDRPPPPRRRWRGGGSVCVTARGNCPAPPLPPNSSCACDIPGFGVKRGATAY